MSLWFSEGMVKKGLVSNTGGLTAYSCHAVTAELLFLQYANEHAPTNGVQYAVTRGATRIGLGTPHFPPLLTKPRITVSNFGFCFVSLITHCRQILDQELMASIQWRQTKFIGGGEIFSITGRETKLRPEWPKLKAGRAESEDWGSWRGGQRAPSAPAWGSGSAVSFPSEVREPRKF